MLNPVSSIRSRGFMPLFGLCLLLSGLASRTVAAENVLLKSPNGQVLVRISPGAQLMYSVKFHHATVVNASKMGIIVDGDNLGQNVALAGKQHTGEINEAYQTRGVHTNAINHYRFSIIPLTGGTNKTPWQLEVRVFDDGVAYRCCIPGAGERHIDGEISEWNVPVGSALWYQSASNTSYESRFQKGMVGQLPQGLKLMAPATLKFPGHAGYGMMSEANMINYSDMSLRLEDTNSFQAFFHNSSKGWVASGEITSPWRVTLLASDLNSLINSDIIKNLCPPPSPELAHASWIRPGRSAWGWLSCYCSPKLEDQHAWVDNTRKLGWEYYLIDDGWKRWNGGGSNAWNAMADVVNYAKSQGVDVWIWVRADEVFDAKDRMAYFRKAKSIGVVGLKIDFPKPADPVWVNWYDDCLRDAASLELMLDFHGAVKPTGRARTWPNELNREAIAGREQGKNPPLHDTTLPFVRYVQGHADYTPTLFMPGRLKGSTYPHELAMAIVYTAPFLCMGDNPTNYLDSKASDVLKALPPVWDQTIVLPQSEIGQVAAFARRSGNQWFIGVINDSIPRNETVSLNFLGKGGYKLIELADNPGRDDAFVRTEPVVTRKNELVLPLCKDGGYVARLVPATAK